MLFPMTQLPRPASGYAAWRLIAEELRSEIAENRLPAGARLPSENELAQRFAVNRQTARQAIASLAADGLVQARRGSGTFVTNGPVHVHRIGVRTRLSSSLGVPSESATGRILSHAVEVPPSDIAARLRLTTATAIRVEALRIVDGRPLARSTNWFAADIVPDIVEALERTLSVTAALREFGFEDYLRESTTVTARHATATETTELELEPGSIVIVTHALDVLPDGTPLQVVDSRFAASRVALDIEHS
jgi:GntR family phosphonate transport system transcriptional regulator